jgi:hypothetical protein
MGQCLVFLIPTKGMPGKNGVTYAENITKNAKQHGAAMGVAPPGRCTPRGAENCLRQQHLLPRLAGLSGSRHFQARDTRGAGWGDLFEVQGQMNF